MRGFLSIRHPVAFTASRLLLVRSDTGNVRIAYDVIPLEGQDFRTKEGVENVSTLHVLLYAPLRRQMVDRTRSSGDPSDTEHWEHRLHEPADIHDRRTSTAVMLGDVLPSIEHFGPKKPPKQAHCAIPA